MVKQSQEYFKWLLEHLNEVKQTNSTIDPCCFEIVFDIWYKAEMQLEKICKKLDPNLTVFFGYFNNTLIFENPSNEKIGKLIKILQKEKYDFSILTNVDKNIIEIQIDHGIEENFD